MRGQKKFTYRVKIFAAKLSILPNRNLRNWNCEKVYSENSQENDCAEVSFLAKLQVDKK